MTTTAAIADFFADVSADELSADVREATKQRLYDAAGVAVGGRDEAAVGPVLETATEVSGEGPARLWGFDRSAAVPQAAMVNATLVRSLDYLDSFRAPGGTVHPSEAIPAIVAAAEAVDADGGDLLAAVAGAYQLQGELAHDAAIGDRGFDGVTHTVLAAAGGAAAVQGLDRDAIEHALAVAGVAHNALGVTRTGQPSQWQHAAAGDAARNGAYAALLAGNGVDGPTDLFEGADGWQDVIAGEAVDLALDTACPRVTDVLAKRYLAATDAQSAVEAAIELSQEHYVDPKAVTRIRLTTFESATLGEDDPATDGDVDTPEAAERSLRYMVAVAILDCSMGVDQFEPERIRREDVQDLLGCVEVETDDAFTERFEGGALPARLEIELTAEETLRAEKETFTGHPDRPMDWEQLREKFDAVTGDAIGSGRQDEIEDVVRTLEERDVTDLVECL